MMGLQSIPGIIATYREQGILKRFATTPVHPAKLLVAQLVINVTVTIAGVGLLLVIGPIMFLGGVYLPRPLLPETIQTIGAYVPPGVKALEDAWTGAGAQPLQLAVLAVFAVGSGVVAAKVFRWE